MNFPPSDLYYLAPGFPPAALTADVIKNILAKHNVAAASSLRKADLIELFNDKIAKQRKNILITREENYTDQNGADQNGHERESEDEHDGQNFVVDDDDFEIPYYLTPNFLPTVLSVSALRSILFTHNISVAGVKTKNDLIELFSTKIAPNRLHFLDIEDKEDGELDATLPSTAQPSSSRNSAPPAQATTIRLTNGKNKDPTLHPNTPSRAQSVPLAQNHQQPQQKVWSQEVATISDILEERITRKSEVRALWEVIEKLRLQVERLEKGKWTV